MADADASVAIYWDFENVHACVLDELRGEGSYRAARFKPQEPVVDVNPVAEYAATLGRIVQHRAYCNWQYFGRYRDQLQAHAVDLVQMFPLTASKNGADIRLVLDVVEDMQQHGHITHVIVVASDSDYASLAQRCRKQGRVFIGIGTGVTPKSFQFACDEFRHYRELTVGSGAPAVLAEAAVVEAPLGLEDAAALVVTAVRRLAAGRGEPWALKAAIRPLVKRLDPTFDERRFGFGSFTDLLRALDAYVIERIGENDHELAVRADLDGSAVPAGWAEGLEPLPGTSPAALIERQLRRRGLRLPDDRRLLWIVPELLPGAFSATGTGIEPSFEGLRYQLEPEVAARGAELSEVDFNKVKGVLWRARVFELHGEGGGVSLRVTDPGDLRRRMVRIMLEHLADPASEDAAILTEAIFGQDADGEQERLVTDMLRVMLDAPGEGE